MLIGSLKNTERAETLHPLFKKVFDYVKVHDMLNAPLGKIVIDEGNAWMQVSEVQGKEKTAAALESHDEFIDIQIPLSGAETFGWQARESLRQTRGEGYDASNDITFYTDAPKLYFTLSPDDFCILFPEDGHAPCIGEGTIKKIVAKVRI